MTFGRYKLFYRFITQDKTDQSQTIHKYGSQKPF